jgi:hypothetical protein
MPDCGKDLKFLSIECPADVSRARGAEGKECCEGICIIIIIIIIVVIIIIIIISSSSSSPPLPPPLLSALFHCPGAPCAPPPPPTPQVTKVFKKGGVKCEASTDMVCFSNSTTLALRCGAPAASAARAARAGAAVSRGGGNGPGACWKRGRGPAAAGSFPTPDPVHRATAHSTAAFCSRAACLLAWRPTPPSCAGSPKRGDGRRRGPVGCLMTSGP